MTDKEAIQVLNMIETHGALAKAAKEKALEALKEKEEMESAIDWWRKKTEAEQRARMTNQEAAQILQEEANGIPSDLYDEQSEKFREAVRIARQALNTMPFIQDMSDTIDRLRAENPTVPVEIEYNNQKRHGYYDKKRLLIFPEYITAEMATKIGMTWKEEDNENS